jgi:hypothetical protein
MRRQEHRGLAVILAAAMMCALLPWAWAQGAGPLVPGVGLADIPLGSRISEVVTRLGAPNAVQLVNTNGTLAYTFDQYGITAYTVESRVVALTTTNSLLGMVRGVGLGSSRESVMAVFGPPRSVGLVEGFPGIMYDSLGIGFGLDRHEVAVVMVFQPVSSPIQPAVPPSSPSAPASPAVTSQGSQDDASTMSTGPSVANPSTTATVSTTLNPGVAPVQPRVGQTVGQAVPSGEAADLTVGSGASLTANPAAPVTTIPQSAASAEDTPGVADISRLRPFTVETKYLSLAGYLRYLIYGMTGRWIGPRISELIMHPQESPPLP